MAAPLSALARGGLKAAPAASARCPSLATSTPAAGRPALAPPRRAAGDDEVSVVKRELCVCAGVGGTGGPSPSTTREKERETRTPVDPDHLSPPFFFLALAHIPQAKPAAAAAEDDDLWIERELRRRAKKRAAADKGAGPTVVAPAVEKARATAAGGGTAMDAAEVGYRRFLGAYGVFILLEGLVLGGSGFLPDAWDAWISGTLYPSFSPTVGVFLLFSSAYGAWKAKQGDGGGA